MGQVVRTSGFLSLSRLYPSLLSWGFARSRHIP